MALSTPLEPAYRIMADTPLQKTDVKGKSAYNSEIIAEYW